VIRRDPAARRQRQRLVRAPIVPPVDAKREKTGVEQTQLRSEVRLGARDDGPDEPKRERDHAETERI
jgi:hypothetical protein